MIRRKSLFYTLLGATAALLIGFSVVRGPLAMRPRRPVLVVDQPHRSLGTVVPGSTTVIAFPITNAGRGHLVLTDLDPSCGCSPPSLSRSRVESGGTETLTVQFRASQEPGPFAHAIEFRTNDLSHKVFRVTFSGRAAWPLEVEPASLRLSATSRDPIPPTAKLELFSIGGTPFDVRSVRSDPWIKVEDVSEASEPHRKRYQVRVERDVKVGVVYGTILFETSEAGRPTLIVPLQCEFLATSNVSPKRLMLSPSKVGSLAELTFYIAATDGTATDIDKVEAVGGGWLVSHWSSERVDANRSVCRVQIQLPKTPGYSRSAIRFYRSKENVIDEAALSGLVTQ